MGKNLTRLKEWHETKVGYSTAGVIELGLAVLFGSLAIDSGSLFQYFLTLLFAGAFVRNVILVILLFVRKK